MQRILVSLLILSGCCTVQAEDGIFSREITLVNSIPYQQYGVCYVGKTPANQVDADWALFRTEEGEKVLFQAVPDPGGEQCSLYADLNHSASDFCILSYGSLTLRPEKQQMAKTDFKSSLSIDAETGEMGNGKIRLKIDKKTGVISSLKHQGIDHDLADVSGNGKNGLNDYRPPSDKPGPKSVKLTPIADGPLVAVMLVETAFSGKPTLYTQVTVIADSERFKIENIFAKENDSQDDGHVFAFAFQIPEGKWRLEPTYLTYYAENYGVDWVGPNPDQAKTEDSTVISRVSSQNNGKAFEFWLWPYRGPFSEEVASRFARKVQNPLRLGGEK